MSVDRSKNGDGKILCLEPNRAGIRPECDPFYASKRLRKTELMCVGENRDCIVHETYYLDQVITLRKHCTFNLFAR